MITPEERAGIRRLYYAEHWKVDTIARELGLHHSTVRRALELDRVSGDARPRSSLLDPYRPFIRDTLERHPRLRATRIHEMIRARGYEGSVVQLRRYVRTIRPAARAEAYLRLETMPGEQAQVDWGHFGKIRVGTHAERPLSCFVIVASWSRAMYARFTLDQSLESFLREHVRGFAAMGGVPRAVLYDNLKSVVLERVGDHIRYHPRLLELAGHYHFAPKPCAPYRGNEKGRVERTIRYLRDSFFAARRFRDLDDLNQQLDRWIRDIAHQRAVPGDPAGRTVSAALDEERPRLLPLPEHPFEVDLVKPVRSGKTPYIRFDANQYSIPHTHVRKPLTLVAGEHLVRVLDGTNELARHVRSYDRKRVVEHPDHIAALARDKRAAHELTGQSRVRALGPHAARFLDALVDRGEPLGRHTARLLKLLDRYGDRELEAALEQAIARGAISAESVAHILDQRARARKAPPPLDVVLPADPRVRDLRVTRHRLADYDRLLGDGADDKDNDR